MQFIIARITESQEEIGPAVDDQNVFVRDNFDKFNFPFQNQGSFTVNLQDSFADLWQNCLDSVYGEPSVMKNSKGTVTDTFWKFMYENIEITLHFYNHNKPKDKKTSKMLVQGVGI